MKSIFEELFKDVSTATNGKIGLSDFKAKMQKNEPYDLVMIDINMPIMNGINMIKEIHQINPTQPIIVTSAHNDTHYLVELLNLGINAFLIKPIDSSAMNKTLYNIAKSIKNEKLIKEHYATIEELNKELLQKSDELERANQELHYKNIALEKSTQIIEDMNHQAYMDELISGYEDSNQDENELNSKDISNSTKQLKDIESIISNLTLKYNKNNDSNRLLSELSSAIKEYELSLPKENKYKAIKNSFQTLSEITAKHPLSSQEEELHRLFTMLESFFYTYTKWQNKTSNISDQQFKIFMQRFVDDISMIIKLWQCDT